MRYAYGAAALTLLNQAYTAMAQDCPTGYNRTVVWRSCPTTDEPTLQCAILQVPLDYSNPTSSASMNIPLVRVQATVANPNGEQSIIYNPGGPGGSGIESFAGGAGSYLQERFGAQYNWISFDPRGVGLSTPFANGQQNYNCPSEGFQQGPFETDSQISSAVVGYRAQGQTCGQNPQGDNGQYIGTTFVARDIVAISQALSGHDGYVRYYGASYGTLLGSTLAAMFPTRMERVVLDGNINPTDYYYGLGDEAAADIDDGVANFFRECVAAGPNYCALANGSTAEELQAEFNNYLASIYTPSDNYQNWYDLRTEFENVLKVPSNFPGFSQTLAGYYGNNGTNSTTRVKRQNANFDPTQAQAAANQQSLALYGVTCNDFEGPRVVDEATFKRYRDIYKARSSYAGDGGLLWILYTCSAWQTKAKEQFSAQLTGVQTRKPVLFVNTIYDPVTPLVSAQNSSAGFVGSGVLVSNGAGHCSSAERNPVLDAAMASYFSSGNIPAQRQYNKTTLSFEQGRPIGTDAEDITGDRKGGKLQHAVYPRELLRMLSEQADRVAKRQAGPNVPAGCTAIGGNGTVTTSSSTSSTSTSMTSSSSLSSSSGSSTSLASSMTTTSGSSAASGWSTWLSAKSTMTTPSNAHSWSAWSASSMSTSPTSAKAENWAIWSGKAIPTTTVYVTGIVDVCPTGLITKTVTITATCAKGCYEKPTGVPEGYTTAKVWCDNCATKGYVEVTSSMAPSDWAVWQSTSSKPATSTAVSSWAGWNNGNANKPADNGAAYTWSEWQSGANGNKDKPSSTWSQWNGNNDNKPASTWAAWAENGNAEKPAENGAANWESWNANANGNNKASSTWADWSKSAASTSSVWNAWNNGVSTASGAQSPNGAWNGWVENGQSASASWQNWASSASPTKTQSASASWSNWSSGNGPAPTGSSAGWNEWESGKGATSTGAKTSSSAWESWAATPTSAKGSSATWNEWAAGTGLVQVYKGAAGRASVGFVGMFFAFAAALLL